MWEKGQKVILYCSNGSKEVAVIDRVTPSGIAVIGNLKYNKNGFRIPRELYGHGSIKEATEEEIEKVRREDFVKKTVFRMNMISWGDVIKDYETATKAREFLKGLEE